MKNFVIITLLIALFSFTLLVGSQTTACTSSQGTEQLNTSNTAVPPSAHLAGEMEVNFEKDETAASLSGGFIARNWGALTLSLLALAETIVRLTPSQKDNSILKLIATLLNSIIPNNKKGGGVF